MKVLHVIPSLSPALGGPTQAVTNMVRALRSLGVEAEIVTTNDNRAELLDVPLNRRVLYQGIPVWFLPRFSLPMKEFIFSAALTRWLWQHSSEYSLLHNHYLFSYASTCAGAIARQRKIPYVVRTIGQLTPWALAQSRFKKQIYTAVIERHNLQRAAAIHCTTPGEAADVRNFGITTPTITLPLGVERSPDIPVAPAKLRDRYQIPCDRTIILFLSRLHYKKRPDLLIESLSKLDAQNYDFHLLLAGSGESDYLDYLQNLVAKYGLGDRVSFVGFVSGTDKDLLLQGADIFALPSHSENFGIAVAEAMVAGLPVIVTPGVQIAPAIAAVQAGFVVEGEIASLTEAIARLIDAPQLRSQMGENARNLAMQKYSWGAIASQLINYYSALVEQKSVDFSRSADLNRSKFI